MATETSADFIAAADGTIVDIRKSFYARIQAIRDRVSARRRRISVALLTIGMSALAILGMSLYLEVGLYEIDGVLAVLSVLGLFGFRVVRAFSFQGYARDQAIREFSRDVYRAENWNEKVEYLVTLICANDLIHSDIDIDFLCS